MFRSDIAERVLEGAAIIVQDKATVRETAKKLHVSKSTVFKDMTDRLPLVNGEIYSEVRQVLDLNKDERHMRGGMATKSKFEAR